MDAMGIGLISGYSVIAFGVIFVIVFYIVLMRRSKKEIAERYGGGKGIAVSPSTFNGGRRRTRRHRR